MQKFVPQLIAILLFNIAISTHVLADAPPVNQGVFPRTVPEDTALPITNLSVTDPDSAANEKLDQVKLSVTNNGTLTVPPETPVPVGQQVTSGATLIAGALGTKTFTLKGTQTELNAALKSLKYQGINNFDGTDVLTVESTDKKGKKDIYSANITVTQVSHSTQACDWSKAPGVYTGDLLDNWSAGPTASYTLVQYNLADKKSTLNTKALGAGISFRYYRSDHLERFGQKFLGLPYTPAGTSTPDRTYGSPPVYAEQTTIADIPAGCRAQSTDFTGDGIKIASWYSISPTMYVFQEKGADDLGVQLALNFGFLNDIFSVGVGWNVSGDDAGEWFILAGPSFGFSF